MVGDVWFEEDALEVEVEKRGYGSSLLRLGLFMASGSSSSGLKTATRSPWAPRKKYEPPVPASASSGSNPCRNPCCAARNWSYNACCKD